MTGETITSADELDALPVGSVLGYVGGAAHREYRGGSAKPAWRATNGGTYRSAAALAHEFGRLTVLYRPDRPVGQPSQREADLDRLVEELVGERDGLEDIADRLAAAIAPAEVLGEHSSANDPWQNALDFAADRPSGVTVSSEDREALAGALGNVLCTWSNYPDAIAPHILGARMGPLIEKAVDAVLAAHPRPAPSVSRKRVEVARQGYVGRDAALGFLAALGIGVREP